MAGTGDPPSIWGESGQTPTGVRPVGRSFPARTRQLTRSAVHGRSRLPGVASQAASLEYSPRPAPCRRRYHRPRPLASVTLLSESANAAPAKPVDRRGEGADRRAEPAGRGRDAAVRPAQEKTDHAARKTEPAPRAGRPEDPADERDAPRPGPVRHRAVPRRRHRRDRRSSCSPTTREQFLNQSHMVDRLSTTQEQALETFKVQQEQASTSSARRPPPASTQLTAAQKQAGHREEERRDEAGGRPEAAQQPHRGAARQDRLARPPRLVGEQHALHVQRPRHRSRRRGHRVRPRAAGKPYERGATGPNSYDCSGLTQAAYHAAGITIGRTTWDQIKDGTRVSQSDLRPGDLVFFYSGISHVGIYIGNGNIVHAPHTGAVVEIAPMSWMPFAGAVRLA